MHRAIHRSRLELPLGGECNALLGDPKVVRDDVRPRRSPAVLDGCARGAADAHVWIHDEVAGGGERQDEPFDELDRELAWMGRFLHVVGLHVREDPQVAGVLSQGCPVYWPAFFPFLALLPGYFWGTRTGSRSNRYASPLVNHKITSYRPEKRFEQCSPCSKCQTMRLRSRSSACLWKYGKSRMSSGRTRLASTW